MSKFTPGPWEIVGATIIWSPTGKATVAAVSELRDLEYVRFTPVEIGSPNFEECYANARLIAAAPELLEALNACLPFIDDADDICQFFPDSAATAKCRAAVALAKAAIAKAGAA